MPTVLWFSTGLLILSSIALQTAVLRRAPRRARRRPLRPARRRACPRSPFSPASCWPGASLPPSGYFTAANPASAFFYLITAIHGLHMLGGLVALCRTASRAFAVPTASAPQATAELRARRRALRHLLALPAAGLARPLQSSHALDGRSDRDLSGIADLEHDAEKWEPVFGRPALTVCSRGFKRGGNDERSLAVHCAYEDRPPPPAGPASSRTGRPISGRSRTSPGGRP